MKIILGLTGSVATVLAPKMLELFNNNKVEVRMVATNPALYFLPKKFIKHNIKKGHLFIDKYEWPKGNYYKNDPVRHIEFRTWADKLVIAPISANTLAKISYGLCDNFLSCIARAWPKTKPLILSPAMNTEMWDDVITFKHIAKIEERFKLTLIPPVTKKLACGEIGKGAMADIHDIINNILEIK